MSYKVRIRSSIRRRVVAWNLPDFVFVEVFLRLEQELGKNASTWLVRASWPFDGMVYNFSMVDPNNRLVEHFFSFHIMYHSDEETLLVVNCSHVELGL